MKLWCRFVRWLARNEIAEAYEAASSMTQALCMERAEALARMALARGECAGRQQMADAIEGAVTRRMNGGSDLIELEDIERAKKGLLH